MLTASSYITDTALRNGLKRQRCKHLNGIAIIMLMYSIGRDKAISLSEPITLDSQDVSCRTKTQLGK